jgi:hypothetical protein
MIERRKEKAKGAAATPTKQRLVIVDDVPAASSKTGGCC